MLQKMQCPTQSMRHIHSACFKNKFSGLFQDFSKTQIDFSRTLKFTLPFHSQDLNVNSPNCLPYISYFYLSLTDFQNFPGPTAFFQYFPVLENATKKFQDFPGHLCMMATLDVILSNKQWPSCILIGCIFYILVY